MNKWLDQAERRFGRFAVANLMNYVIAGQIVVFAAAALLNGNVLNQIILYRSALLHGQIWRLLTFVLEPLNYSILYFVISAYLYWYIGNALEAQWGSVHFCAYFVLGMLGAVLACLLTGYCDNYNLFLSLFLAFAVLYPEMQLLVFFIIPVKVKWLGWISAALWLVGAVTNGVPGFLQSVCGLLGFFVFFGGDCYRDIRAWVRREQWKRRNR